MSEFKAGDKVRLKRSQINFDSRPEELKFGSEYTVRQPLGSVVHVVGVSGSWKADRFEKVEEEKRVGMFGDINKGDTVRVVLRDGSRLEGKVTAVDAEERLLRIGSLDFHESKVFSVNIRERAPKPLEPGLYTNTDGERILITTEDKTYYTHRLGAWINLPKMHCLVVRASEEVGGWKRDIAF